MALTLQDIEQLFLERGHRSYDGESVSHLRHALQTAALAERHHAGPELITACLLHDLGHLIADRPGTPTLRGRTTSTSTSCCPSCAACSARACWSRSGCTSRPSATSAIWSPTMKRRSRRTRSAAWRCRGSFDAGQALDFASLPGAPDAIRLRRWDDMAKVPGLITPSLEHYLEIAESVSTRAKLAAIH